SSPYIRGKRSGAGSGRLVADIEWPPFRVRGLPPVVALRREAGNHGITRQPKEAQMTRFSVLVAGGVFAVALGPGAAAQASSGPAGHPPLLRAGTSARARTCR